jgi:hypothetical protein
VSDEAVAIPLGDESGDELDPRAISPELVMVDPELGRKAKAALCSRAAELERAEQRLHVVESETDSAVDRGATRATVLGSEQTRASTELAHLQVELTSVLRKLEDARDQLIEAPKRERQRRREVMVARFSGALGVFFGAVLFASLLMNLGFIGFFVGGSVGRPTLAPAAPAPAPASSVASSAQQAEGTERPPVVRENLVAKTRAQRLVARRLVRMPRTRLPAILVDRRTGLLKNNVNIVCRTVAAGRRSTFVCAVRLRQSPTRVRVYVSAGRAASTTRWVGLRP